MERRILFFIKSWAAVGLVAAVLFGACPSGRWSVRVEGTEITPTCTQRNEMTTCVCSAEGGVTEEAGESTSAATVSESINGITIQCPSTEFEFAPSKATDVCFTEDNTASLKACKDSQKSSSIKEFLNLASDSTSPQWTEVESHNYVKTLTLAPATFPLTDKHFFAGCLKTKAENDECVVKVSVKARTSAVKDGVLICAYGEESNSSVPEAALNSENNSLTILCGSEGQMEPTKESLTAYHCTDSNTDECKIVNLTEVMPTFTSSWWTTDELNSKAPKLVIPEDGFPAQEETILLGCNLNNNVVSRHEDDNGTTAAQLPTCKVKVTLAASSSRSQASSVSFRGLFVLVFVPLVLLGTC
ncbi:srs domain-containing protein [Neospora caninum Liverpool]|uniref:Srs domain-containing protein n=1 Tax=Neospora caninum (strain Liverpool) TaxID=572307 RepID=F0VCF2_NEOCL|nr:srs domain-containing protein [Neospora caninum Liverpool]CBZ51274.1 srs domain-containing protein [Neospora caninum Liverpool]CEL68589.1 TPA: SRS domain-containing protein [Neospora caninum Liverpool]|eukprot:XP_003881307.1 srs domain-containing protein [Neospora caninum Liverpool]